jgi:hypothetical protein
MRNAVLLAAMMLGALGWAQGEQTDQGAVQQKLNSQFQLTQLSKDRTNVVSTGTTLRLKKDGLVMYVTSSPMPSSNTYKNGKISQGGGGFGRDFAITMAQGGQGTANDLPRHKFTANDAVWVVKIDVHANDVTLRLCSNPGDGMLYYGDLKIPFDKGSNLTPEQVVAKVGEVLTVEGSAPDVQTAAIRPAAAHSAAELKLPALYVSSQNSADQLKLNADKSFQLQEEGQPYHGTFTANGDNIELSIAETNSTTTVTLHGNSITDTSGHTWTLRN